MESLRFSGSVVGIHSARNHRYSDVFERTRIADATRLALEVAKVLLCEYLWWLVWDQLAGLASPSAGCDSGLL